MAVTTSKTADQPIFESVFNAVAHAFSCYVQKASQDIPRYVFRDLLHI